MHKFLIISHFRRFQIGFVLQKCLFGAHTLLDTSIISGTAMPLADRTLPDVVWNWSQIVTSSAQHLLFEVLAGAKKTSTPAARQRR
jgi:hypothetical protein